MSFDKSGVSSPAISFRVREAEEYEVLVMSSFYDPGYCDSQYANQEKLVTMIADRDVLTEVRRPEGSPLFEDLNNNGRFGRPGPSKPLKSILRCVRFVSSGRRGRGSR